MYRSINQGIVISVWLTLLLAVAVAGALSGVSITIGASALWLVACVVPPAILMLVWGPPPPTVAETLHAVERRQ